MADMNVKKILVLITGGTLNMKVQGTEGLKPTTTNDLEACLKKRGILQEQKDQQHSFYLSGKENIVCTIVSREEAKLVDSSNIKAEDWKSIAEEIKKHYDAYDGFVIVHGTDTMVYTASALSFIFDNLQKPVVLTGSQIPIYDIGSDGENNFKSAVYFAAYAAKRIPEVVICFNNKVFRGNRTAKKDCVKYDAYESPNYPALATVDNEGRIEVTSDEFIQRQNDPEELRLNTLNSQVCLLKLFPGITTEIVQHFMKLYQGVVLETYGAGNAPLALKKAFNKEQTEEDAIEDASKNVIEGKDVNKGKGVIDDASKNVIVVNVTQCLRGGVTMSYETGKALEDAGVIPCGDMTTSAAFTKLCYLLGKGNLNSELREFIKEEMKRNLKGEITEMSRYRN